MPFSFSLRRVIRNPTSILSFSLLKRTTSSNFEKFSFPLSRHFSNNESNERSGFSELDLSEPLVSALRKSGLFNPTPIQSQAIPRILQGHSMVLSAETGTGKTLAYLLPLLQKIKFENNSNNIIKNDKNDKNNENNERKGEVKKNKLIPSLIKEETSPSPSCLILTPTTELASQVHSDVTKMLKYLKNVHVELLTSATSGGNASKRSFIIEQKSISILIATPGRLLHLLKQGSLKVDPEKDKQIQFLHSLDPTNPLNDKKHIPETTKTTKNHLKPSQSREGAEKDKTEPNPNLINTKNTKKNMKNMQNKHEHDGNDEMNNILLKGLRNDYLLNVKYWVLDECDRMVRMGMLDDVKKLFSFLPRPNKELDWRMQVILVSATILPEADFILKRFSPYREILNLNPNFQVAKSVKHIAYKVNSFRKHALLAYLLRRRGSMKEKRVLIFVRTMKRAEQLCELLKSDGFGAFHVHGERSAGARRQILDSFKNDKFQCLVCTDVLGRGIDIPELPFVVNYDAPSHAEEYVHRVGRTGRAGSEGMAISFISKIPFAVKCGEGFKLIDESRNLKDIEKLIQCKIETRKVPGPWMDNDNDERIISIQNFNNKLELENKDDDLNKENNQVVKKKFIRKIKNKRKTKSRIHLNRKK